MMHPNLATMAGLPPEEEITPGMAFKMSNPPNEHAYWKGAFVVIGPSWQNEGCYILEKVNGGATEFHTVMLPNDDLQRWPEKDVARLMPKKAFNLETVKSEGMA